MEIHSYNDCLYTMQLLLDNCAGEVGVVEYALNTYAVPFYNLIFTVFVLVLLRKFDATSNGGGLNWLIGLGSTPEGCFILS